MTEAEEFLREAIDLQLNEMARLCDVREYLIENQVNFAPIAMPNDAAFASAERVLTA